MEVSMNQSYHKFGSVFCNLRYEMKIYARNLQSDRLKFNILFSSFYLFFVLYLCAVRYLTHVVLFFSDLYWQIMQLISYLQLNNITVNIIIEMYDNNDCIMINISRLSQLRTLYMEKYTRTNYIFVRNFRCNSIARYDILCTNCLGNIYCSFYNACRTWSALARLLLIYMDNRYYDNVRGIIHGSIFYIYKLII